MLLHEKICRAKLQLPITSTSVLDRAMKIRNVLKITYLYPTFFPITWSIYIVLMPSKWNKIDLNSLNFKFENLFRYSAPGYNVNFWQKGGFYDTYQVFWFSRICYLVILKNYVSYIIHVNDIFKLNICVIWKLS